MVTCGKMDPKGSRQAPILLFGFGEHSWARRINEHDKQQCFEELTVLSDSLNMARPFVTFPLSVTVNKREELPNALRIIRGPELLKYLDSAQGFGFCLFESVLSTPRLSLHPHHMSQNVCVMVVDRVRLGIFEVSVRVAKPAFIGKQVCHG